MKYVVPRGSVLMLVLMLTVNGHASAGTYAAEMSNAVKKALGGQISSLSQDQRKALTWYTYPTDNFGVGNMSILSTAQSDARSASPVCAPANCLNRPGGTSGAVLDYYGYAGVGTGPAITVSQKSQRAIAIGAMLSGVANVLGITATAVQDKSTAYTLSIGRGYVRQLDKIRLQAFLHDSLPDGDPRKLAFTEGRLVVNDVDVLVDDLDLVMHIDTKAFADVAARLDNIAKIGAAGDTILHLRLDSTTSGTYHIASTGRVVVAAASFKQRAKGRLLMVPHNQWVPAALPGWLRHRPIDLER